MYTERMWDCPGYSGGLRAVGRLMWSAFFVSGKGRKGRWSSGHKKGNKHARAY